MVAASGPLTVYHGPWMLFGLELLAPGLLKMCHLFWRPLVVQGVDSLDALNEDLISRILVFVAAQIIGAVQKSPFMVAKMSSHCLAQCCSVAGHQSLSFNSPDTNWLYAPFV